MNWVSLVAQLVKNLPAMQETQETWVWSMGWEDPLEKEMATHSSILAWEIPWTEETGGHEIAENQTWLRMYPCGLLVPRPGIQPMSSALKVQFSHSVVSDSLQPHEPHMPGVSVHHQLLEFTQTHVHWVSDAIQPSHPLSSPSLPTFHLSQHQGLFQWVSSSQQVTKVLEFQLQHRSFQWIFKTDFL